jgi:hypothetical protein
MTGSVETFQLSVEAATPLAERIGQESFRRLIETAGEALRPFTVAGGGVELPIGGHLITAAKAA